MLLILSTSRSPRRSRSKPNSQSNLYIKQDHDDKGLDPFCYRAINTAVLINHFDLHLKPNSNLDPTRTVARLLDHSTHQVLHQPLPQIHHTITDTKCLHNARTSSLLSSPPSVLKALPSRHRPHININTNRTSTPEIQRRQLHPPQPPQQRRHRHLPQHHTITNSNKQLPPASPSALHATPPLPHRQHLPLPATAPPFPFLDLLDDVGAIAAAKDSVM